MLTRLLDPGFDEASFAYRSGRSVQQATARIKDCRNLGLRWVVDCDIHDYFDSINHATLLTSLRCRLSDGSLTALLAQWRAAPVLDGGKLRPRRRGVPQGSPVSPLLANLYLHPLDCAVTGADHTLVRYADDFLILCRSRVEAESAMVLTRTRLADPQRRLFAALHSACAPSCQLWRRGDLASPESLLPPPRGPEPDILAYCAVF